MRIFLVNTLRDGWLNLNYDVYLGYLVPAKNVRSAALFSSRASAKAAITRTRKQTGTKDTFYLYSMEPRMDCTDVNFEL